jgi:hypothetical protein
MTLISTANTNLDGSGTLGTILTAASGNDASGRAFQGCRIESISIKATTNTDHGIVRFYIYDGSSNTKLISEVNVPAVTKSATVQSYEARISLGNFELHPGYVLKASTEKANSFAIVAEGLDWVYPA